MPKLKPETIIPTREEDALIRTGIKADPDTRELDDKWFRKARPASETHPQVVDRYRRTRGKQKAPTKERITIRLDADIAAHFRAGGPGWQSRLNNILRDAIAQRTKPGS